MRHIRSRTKKACFLRLLGHSKQTSSCCSLAHPFRITYMNSGACLTLFSRTSSIHRSCLMFGSAPTPIEGSRSQSRNLSRRILIWFSSCIKYSDPSCFDAPRNRLRRLFHRRRRYIFMWDSLKRKSRSTSRCSRNVTAPMMRRSSIWICSCSSERYATIPTSSRALRRKGHPLLVSISSTSAERWLYSTSCSRSCLMRSIRSWSSRKWQWSWTSLRTTATIADSSTAE